ncbi:MAG: hypothetical protein V3V95_03360 [Thermodesulfobacteriota bacterium]
MLTKLGIKKLGRFAVAALFLFALTATPVMLGCGKKAPPKPPKTKIKSVTPR